MTVDLVLTPADRAVDELIGVLERRGYVVIGPRVRDGAIVLDELHDVTNLPVGWTDEQEAATYRLHRRDDRSMFAYAVGPQSPRRYLSPPKQTLWSALRIDGGFEFEDDVAEPPPYAFVGVRACELAAIAVQDRVLRDGPHPDPSYVRAREQAFFVGVNCGSPAATCFCTSMGTGPSVDAGHDLAATELLDEHRHELVVEVGTERGAEVLAEVQSSVSSRAATDDDLEAARNIITESVVTMTRRLDPVVARDVLISNLEHPRWDDVAGRCLSCTNCTLVCPTCFCSAVEDVTSLDGDRAERVQRWDSCFTLGHSSLHGAGSVRGDTRSRYRQWLTHKLSTWWDQFGESGCVGCGRCISWCPAGIDLTEEVAAIARENQT
ncbi:MAG: 4Fe-4S dicluster domain-containing protein [Actinomycetota bacterium]|nr:4Fe-4S dicluster domain-containing protein [Actinomycetota bacterium]